MAVFASDHVRLGHVADVASNHIVVEEGLVLPDERYVPLGAIASVDDEDGIHLYLDAADVAGQAWSAPPLFDGADFHDYGASRAADFESGD